MARPKAGQEKDRPERVAFWISKDLKAKLLKHRTETRSMGDIANEALEAYFKQRGRKAA